MTRTVLPGLSKVGWELSAVVIQCSCRRQNITILACHHRTGTFEASWVVGRVRGSFQIHRSQHFLHYQLTALVFENGFADVIFVKKIVFLCFLLVTLIGRSCNVLEHSHQVWLHSMLIWKLQQAVFTAREHLSSFEALTRRSVEVVNFVSPLLFHNQ